MSLPSHLTFSTLSTLSLLSRSQLERLRPVIDPTKASQSGDTSRRRADVNWREQQRIKEEKEYQAAVDAAAAENEVGGRLGIFCKPAAASLRLIKGVQSVLDCARGGD